MKTNETYRVRVKDITMASDLEYYCMSNNIEYERDGRIFMISDEEFVAKLNKDLVTVTKVKIEEKEPKKTFLTKDELIREIERDIEAVIFNYEEECKNLEENFNSEVPDWRKNDFMHMKRALKLIDHLKNGTYSEE